MPAKEEQLSSRFLELPGEIREAIYHEILDSRKNKHDLADGFSQYKFDLALMLVNRQIYHEVRRVFRRDNIFVTIVTPWPEAQQHVAMEGQVPIVVKNEAAVRFKGHHMVVTIDAPQHTQHYLGFKFVVLIEDLPLFTQMWQYQDLTHRGLNAHLRLTLDLKYPYTAEYDAHPIPKATQKQLLEPFGMIKGLAEVRVSGEHYPSLEKSMREAMDVPYTTPEACLEESNRFKDLGNEAIKKQDYRTAIQHYIESFRAMHIVCKGRMRAIWGDAWFSKVLQGGTFDGQEGLMVRLVLRVKLVANIVQAYLKLEEWDEARYWGMRTITMMRQALDEEDFVPGFVAADPMGKIYYRTGVAYKKLGDEAEARALLRVAEKYLPNDQNVKKELASVALRLG